MVRMVDASSYEVAKEYFQKLLQKISHPLKTFEKVPDMLGNDAYVDNSDETGYGIFLVGNIVMELFSMGKQKVPCNLFLRDLYLTLHDIPHATSITYPSGQILSAKSVILVGSITPLNIYASGWHKLILDGPGSFAMHNGQLHFIGEEAGAAIIDLYALSRDGVVKDTIAITVQ